MSTPTPQQILVLPMQQPNDACAATIRDYLLALLSRLWGEGETFSGKRPLGNSCWEYDLYAPLVRAGYIAGTFEIYDGKEGSLDECDHVAGDGLIEAAIKALGQPAAQPQDAQPERDGDDDVRAVAAALQAWAVGDNTKLGSALMALREVFIARIAELQVRTTRAELDAREAKAGE